MKYLMAFLAALAFSTSIFAQQTPPCDDGVPCDHPIPEPGILALLAIAGVAAAASRARRK